MECLEIWVSMTRNNDEKLIIIEMTTKKFFMEIYDE